MPGIEWEAKFRKNMDWKKFALDLIRLLKPKYYNRITWLIVLTGLGLFSRPLWLEVLSVIAQQTYDFYLIDERDSVYGLILVTIGLIYNLAMNFGEELLLRPKREEDRQKDRDVFESIQNVWSEEDVQDLCDLLIGDESITFERVRAMSGIIHSSRLKRNLFNNSELNASRKTFVDALEDLENFIGTNFFTFPRTSTRLRLRPELNVDREGTGSKEEFEKHTSYHRELTALTFEMKNHYLSFRQLVRETLML